MEKRWLIPLIIFIVIAGILTVVVPILLMTFVWGTYSCAMYNYYDRMPSADKPSITYAEFPFTLVYEQHGEEIILNDTLICEYTGDEIGGTPEKKYRHWDESYGSGVDKLILGQRNTDEYVEYIVFTDGYYPAFLMGDTEHYLYDRSSASFGVTREKHYTGGKLSGTSYSAISDGELYRNYGIKLISFEMHASPAENTFVPAE